MVSEMTPIQQEMLMEDSDSETITFDSLEEANEYIRKNKH